MHTRTIIQLSLLLLLLVLPVAAPQATLEIEITQGVSAAVPIAVVPFGWEGQGAAPALDVADVVGSDLTRSGRFRAIPVNAMLEKPTQASAVKFDNWKVLGVTDLVIG